MKTHLPKKLLVALLAAMAAGAMHAEDTPAINISYSDYNAETGRYNAEMTISGPLGGYSAIGYTPCYTAGITGAVSGVKSDALYTVTAPDESGISVDNRPLFVQDAVINMSGASLCYLTAGANSNGGVYGSKTINMTNGYVNYLFGGDLILSDTKPEGGYYAGNPDNKPIKSTGAVTINISGGTVTHSLGVGVNFSGPSPLNTYIEEHGGVSAFAVGGDATINISGDAVIGGSGMDEFNAAGGRYASVDGKLTVNISGGTVNSDLFCGARGAVQNADGSVDRSYVGSGEVNITGGTINADVYGGNSYSGSGGGAGYTKGDTRVAVSGGVINGDVYGGGDRDEIKGNTHVELSGGTITGDVYAGGSGRTDGVAAIVGGNTTVTLSGSSLQVGGTIYGGGKDNCTVAGTQTLSIGTEESAFSGSVKVADFTDIVMVNGSATITQLTPHQDGTSLTLGSGTSLTVEGDFTAESIICNGGTLIYSGELIASEIVLNEGSYTVGESTFCGGDAGNGFEQEGKRTSNDIIAATGFNSITDNTGTEYTYDATTGKAYAEGAVDYSTYYINTAEHEATVSEIAEASRDAANGEVRLQKVEMQAGTLNADESVNVQAWAPRDEQGEIAVRGTINMSGEDTELRGNIADSFVNAEGGKLSATLTDSTELTVTGAVEVSGDNSHTGCTFISGKEAKLTVGSENALGESQAVLQDGATLDLNHMAVDNAIEVTGCTLANAENYSGRMGVSSKLNLAGPASAEYVSLRDAGAIIGESLRTTVLEADRDRGQTIYSENTISADITINNNGAIILYNGKQITLTSGNLTLGNNITMVLTDDGGLFAAGDTLVSCLSGTITGDISTLYYSVNGVEQEGFTVEKAEDGKSFVLSETEEDNSGEGDKPIVDPEEDEEDKPIVGPEEDEEDKPIVGPETPDKPVPAPVFDQATADVLAQGNWGIFTASRAFTDAIRGQRNTMGCIAGGRGTAWAALLGATHDIDGSGAASGSDITLFGAAVGVDMQVGKRSSLGVAFGYADTEVKPGGLADVDQDGGYIALYGEHGLKQFANKSCLALDWTLATGTTESSYLGADWEQDHLQANARLSWSKQVTERFAYNVFGGLEYFASESDRVAGCKSGSVQNLRGELGIGARYVVKQGQQTAADGKGGLTPAAPGCDRIVVYGELSYINDMVRHNPSIEVNGLRGSAANPGRQGVGIEAGATFRIGERWSANANYGFNAMDDSNEHVLNLGASRTF